MFAIVDVNNFYSSVEKVFDPTLASKPLVVLSNNDGCVISRSAEAKELGIKMGQPAYLSRNLFQQHGVQVFSSNYTLYADMSHRIMSILAGFVPEIEIYSIDEAFLNLESLKLYDLAAFGKVVRDKIQQWTGLTVSIGIAKTKTLAKIANKTIKKNKIQSGVLILTDPLKISESLENCRVEDIWGIGKQHAAFLKEHHIHTAWEFAAANPFWVQQQLTVVGRRTQMELQGNPCIAFDKTPESKKGISTTRCFGKDVYDLKEISEALSFYTTRACEKLRKNQLEAGKFSIILHTNVFRQDVLQYNGKTVHKLPVFTNNTNEILPLALKALSTIYKEGICYYKTGIIFSDLKPAKIHQENLFDPFQNKKNAGLMKTIDQINNTYGRGSITFGAEGIDQKWRLKINHLSRKYTTVMNQVIRVKC